MNRPMNSMRAFDSELALRLGEIREQGLYRDLCRVDSAQSPQIAIRGRACLNFSSNDYLGLANDARLAEAAIEALQRYGAGSGASRLICGSLAPHHELEDALASFKRTEAALTFSSGYTAALGAITAWAGKNDIIALDKRVHASLVDGARLSGAKLRVFAHNDLDVLEGILKWADRPQAGASTARRPRVLIVTESVFSMDGDHAPLVQLVELKEKHGAWLMVDEAHATGLYGANGRGLGEACGVSDRIEIQMGTLGKAFGAAGGYICGSRPLIEYLVNRARSFIFSTAPAPAVAAAARAAVAVVQSRDGEARREQLWQRVAQFLQGETAQRARRAETSLLPATVGGLNTRTISAGNGKLSAIIPLVVGNEAKALEAAAALRAADIYLPAIRYPTVRRGQARLRITVTARHTAEDVARLLAALSDLKFPI